MSTYQDDWSVRRSDDFPSLGGGSNRLLCCTSTSCCLTFVGGGLGLVVGGIVGAVRATRAANAQRVAGLGLNICAVMLGLILGSVVGAVVGAGAGFLLDMMNGGWK